MFLFEFFILVFVVPELFLFAHHGVRFEILEFIDWIDLDAAQYRWVVDDDLTFGQVLEVFDNDFVVNNVAVPVAGLVLHELSDGDAERLFFISLWHRSTFLNEFFYVVTIVSKGDFVLRVSQALGFAFQMLGIRHWIWAIDIQFEFGHDVQMIPKLVIEILDVTQMRKKLAHYA